MVPWSLGHNHVRARTKREDMVNRCTDPVLPLSPTFEDPMSIQSIDELRHAGHQHREHRLDQACEHCNHKIAEALDRGETEVRVWTGLDYQDTDLAARLDDMLRDKGYEVDGEMQVRHGYVLDIILPTTA